MNFYKKHRNVISMFAVVLLSNALPYLNCYLLRLVDAGLIGLITGVIAARATLWDRVCGKAGDANERP